MSRSLLTFTASLVIVTIIFCALIFGRDLLIPFAVAIMIWYLLNALAGGYRRIRISGWSPPAWLCMVGSILTVTAALAFVFMLIRNNVVAVSDAAPQYQANLQELVRQVSGWLGVVEPPSIRDVFRQFDLATLISAFAETATRIASNAGVILIYVLFLLIEQRVFERKLSALLPDPVHEASARELLHRIQERIETYVWIKTLTSLLTGGISYVILVSVGVDYAPFWGLVIFLLNYIPTIGSLLGIVFPTLLTIIQFGSFTPFLIVLVLLAGTQVTIGNYLEPRMMGASLNVSPLVVILSLALWGSIWGIAGMLLCVPFTVIAMIICAHFPQTRKVAQLLSQNGNISVAIQKL